MEPQELDSNDKPTGQFERQFWILFLLFPILVMVLSCGGSFLIFWFLNWPP